MVPVLEACSRTPADQDWYSMLDYLGRSRTIVAEGIHMAGSIYSKDYTAVLRRLRQARLSAGLTQEQIAERLSQSQSFVSKCERGERRIDIVELRAFCMALGKPFVEFVAELDALLPHSGDDTGK